MFDLYHHSDFGERLDNLMIRKLKKHVGYYLSLLTIFILGFILTLLASPDIRLQGVIVLITVLFYVCWGILHHLINHELTLRIVIEYVLIGVLGIAIIFFMLSGRTL